MRLPAWLRAPAGFVSVRNAVWLGAGGAALMAGNLVVAGLLAPEDFGRFALIQALMTLGVGLSLLGRDTLAARGEILPTGRSLSRAALTAMPVAILVGTVAAAFYVSLPAAAAVLIAVASAFGAVASMTAAYERALLRFDRAQLVAQMPLFAYLAAGPLLVILTGAGWRAAAAGLAAGYATAALVGLAVFRFSAGRAARTAAGAGESLGAGSVRMGIAFVAISMSMLAQNQMERLVIPQVLTLTDLANFGVVATLVASPYRLLQGGIGYSLMPRLRAAGAAGARRQLLFSELRLALILGAAAAVVLVPLAGPVVHALYGGKYEATTGLVVAIVAVGLARLASGCLTAAVPALAVERQAHTFAVAAWIATGVAVAAAAALSRFGLPGVVCGAGLGWVLRGLAAWWVVASALAARPGPLPAAAPGAGSQICEPPQRAE